MKIRANKKTLRHLFLALMIVLLVGGNVVQASACTAVYVGSDVSEDGTTIIAKSNDYQAVWGNHVTITERVENKPGRVMPVDNDATVLAQLPATTYRYTSTPWMDSVTAMNGRGKDATICSNECGVMMLMSITAFSNKHALTADPLIEHGLTENTAVDLVTCQSATALDSVARDHFVLTLRSNRQSFRLNNAQLTGFFAKDEQKRPGMRMFGAMRERVSVKQRVALIM